VTLNTESVMLLWDICATAHTHAMIAEVRRAPVDGNCNSLTVLRTSLYAVQSVSYDHPVNTRAYSRFCVSE